MTRDVDIVAQRVLDNTGVIKRDSRQRRHNVVDLYGIEYTRSGSPATFYISISHDMVYLERFQFKLIVENSSASDFRISIDGVDITAYLAAQYDTWIDGSGIYPSDVIGESYDILAVCSDLIADGYEDEAKSIASAGYKKVIITSGSSFDITLVNYLKYSHMLR